MGRGWRGWRCTQPKSRKVRCDRHMTERKREKKVKSRYDTQMGRRAVVEEEDPAPETLLC